jgi:hypothetical protein
MCQATEGEQQYLWQARFLVLVQAVYQTTFGESVFAFIRGKTEALIQNYMNPKFGNIANATLVYGVQAFPADMKISNYLQTVNRL